jgi:hypothetical protein
MPLVKWASAEVALGSPASCALSLHNAERRQALADPMALFCLVYLRAQPHWSALELSSWRRTIPAALVSG